MYKHIDGYINNENICFKTQKNGKICLRNITRCQYHSFGFGLNSQKGSMYEKVKSRIITFIIDSIFKDYNYENYKEFQDTFINTARYENCERFDLLFLIKKFGECDARYIHNDCPKPNFEDIHIEIIKLIQACERQNNIGNFSNFILICFIFLITAYDLDPVFPTIKAELDILFKKYSYSNYLTKYFEPDSKYFNKGKNFERLRERIERERAEKEREEKVRQQIKLKRWLDKDNSNSITFLAKIVIRYGRQKKYKKIIDLGSIYPIILRKDAYKSYKKLILLLHPDKSQSKYSEEATKYLNDSKDNLSILYS